VLALVREALASALDELRQTISSAARSLVLLIIAAVLTLLGLVFLLLGIYQSLSADLEAWQAGGIVLLAVLVVALLLAWLASRSGRSRKPRRGATHAGGDGGAGAGARKDDIDAAVAAELGASVWDALKRRRPRAFEMMVASFVAGMLMSRRERQADDDGDAPRRRRRWPCSTRAAEDHEQQPANQRRGAPDEVPHRLLRIAARERFRDLFDG
jgi:membrane protein implicated in regulation of membrane protease activity